jgi:hypothetical protein
MATSRVPLLPACQLVGRCASCCTWAMHALPLSAASGRRHAVLDLFTMPPYGPMAGEYRRGVPRGMDGWAFLRG